jgi:putative membrane protein
MQLLLATAIVLLYVGPWHPRLIFALVSIYLAGLGVEILGVKTGFPFGNYHYGPILGPKIAGTPLLIGINWVLVIVGTVHFARAVAPRFSPLGITILSATFAVLLDLLIEPIAVAFNMWNWTQEDIPPSNFISWWILAALFSAIYQFWGNKSYHWVVIYVYIWLFIFFGSLYIFYL